MLRGGILDPLNKTLIMFIMINLGERAGRMKKNK